MKVYAIFGDTIEHSLSLPMQNAAFSALGLPARYLAFWVKRERLREAILRAESNPIGALVMDIEVASFITPKMLQDADPPRFSHPTSVVHQRPVDLRLSDRVPEGKEARRQEQRREEHER